MPVVYYIMSNVNRALDGFKIACLLLVFVVHLTNRLHQHQGNNSIGLTETILSGINQLVIGRSLFCL